MLAHPQGCLLVDGLAWPFTDRLAHRWLPLEAVICFRAQLAIPRKSAVRGVDQVYVLKFFAGQPRAWRSRQSTFVTHEDDVTETATTYLSQRISIDRRIANIGWLNEDDTIQITLPDELPTSIGRGVEQDHMEQHQKQ